MKPKNKSLQIKQSRRERPIPASDDIELPRLEPICPDPQEIKEPPPQKPLQVGESSYEGTRDYAKDITRYLKTADVEADTKAAAPSSSAEAAELKNAEAKGASRSRAPGT